MGERVHFNCIRYLVYTYIFGSFFGLNSTHLNFKYQT